MHTHTHARTHAHTSTHAYTHTRIQTHTHTHTNTNTHTHTHTHSDQPTWAHSQTHKLPPRTCLLYISNWLIDQFSHCVPPSTKTTGFTLRFAKRLQVNMMYGPSTVI